MGNDCGKDLSAGREKVNRMGRLDGKVALITGAAQGQGEAEARLFSREGASVVVADILEEGEEVAETICAGGGEAIFVSLDITSSEAWESAVAMAVDRFGELTVLVNNAAVFLGEGTVEEVTEEQWDLLLSVNTKGAFLGTRAVIPSMRAAGVGSIVNTSSTAGLAGGNRMTAYATSKAALLNFTRTTARQYANENIRANSILPGPIDTNMLREGLKGRFELAGQNVPMGRLGQPIEIAQGAVYFASDESSWVTGSELSIDGGLRA